MKCSRIIIKFLFKMFVKKEVYFVLGREIRVALKNYSKCRLHPPPPFWPLCVKNCVNSKSNVQQEFLNLKETVCYFV